MTCVLHTVGFMRWCNSVSTRCNLSKEGVEYSLSNRHSLSTSASLRHSTGRTINTFRSVSAWLFSSRTCPVTPKHKCLTSSWKKLNVIRMVRGQVFWLIAASYALSKDIYGKWPRVIEPIVERKNHQHVRLCCPNGEYVNVPVSKNKHGASVIVFTLYPVWWFLFAGLFIDYRSMLNRVIFYLWRANRLKSRHPSRRKSIVRRRLKYEDVLFEPDAFRFDREIGESGISLTEDVFVVSDLFQKINKEQFEEWLIGLWLRKRTIHPKDKIKSSHHSSNSIRRKMQTIAKNV